MSKDNVDVVLQNNILVSGIKAGTLLSDLWEITMSEDNGVGIVGFEFLQLVKQGSFLSWRTGVIILAFFIDATLVADADGVAVVAHYMGTGILFRAPCPGLAILVDVPVVPYPTPPLGLVPALEILDADTLAQLGGGAVHHQVLHFFQLAHTMLMQLCIKKVETRAVMMVIIRLPILSLLGFFISFIIHFVYIIILFLLTHSKIVKLD